MSPRKSEEDIIKIKFCTLQFQIIGERSLNKKGGGGRFPTDNLNINKREVPSKRWVGEGSLKIVLGQKWQPVMTN